MSHNGISVSHNVMSASIQEVCFPLMLVSVPQEYQVEMVCHQLLVDTLNQSVLQPSGTDLPATRYEHALHAEKLGALNLRWLHLKGALCSQVSTIWFPG